MNILVTSLPDLKKINLQRPHHLLKYLSKKHNITILSVNAWWLEEKQDIFLKESLKNIKIHYLSNSKINPVIQEMFALKSKNIDLNSFDVHINFNSLIAGYIIAKKTKIPTVFDICDDLVGWISTSSQIPKLLKPLGKTFGSFMLYKNIDVSKKITCSTQILMNSYKLPKNKSVLSPNGVDINLFYKSSGKNKEQIGIFKDEFVLGFVGFLGEWVDLECIFNAIKNLNNKLNLKMIVVGSGTKFTEFNNLAKKIKINDKVIFIGDVAYLNVPDYISCMDICLLPFDTSAVSLGALPIKLFEYMACEKPIISTPLPGVKSTVGDLVFYANNTIEFEQKILNLYYNINLRNEMGKKGREFVNENYSWEQICSQFENTLIEASVIQENR